MADISAILIDAAAKGRRARDEALAALAQPAPEPTAAEVDAVLATLPAKVAEALTEDPAREVFALMDGIVAHSEPLACAVSDGLRQMGISASVALDPNSDRCAGKWLAVNIHSLLAAGDRAATSAALAAFDAAWSEFTNGDGSCHVNNDAGTLIADSHTGVRSIHTIAPGWQTRPTADLVEEARKALRLPLWRIDDVRAGWKATAATCGLDEAHVAPMHGMTMGTVYRPVPCLVFTAGGEGGVTEALDMADILDMTAAEVVSLAASRLGLTATVADTAEEAAPASAPAAQQALPAVVAAQPDRPLSRKEQRREQYRQRHA